MLLEIKHRYSGSVLFSIEIGSLKMAVEAAIQSKINLQDANLQGAKLQGAKLQGAWLQDAWLQDAKLQGANLQDANLQDANLQDANLQGAKLQGAKLQGAKGINKYLTTPLYSLLDQPGMIRAYKLVTPTGQGPYNGGLTYKIGQSYEILNANTNEQEACAAGINVATLDWCLRGWQEGYRILIVEFTAQDIACIPIGSDGKFRLYRCAVVGEKTLADVGLVKKGATHADP